MRKVFGSNAQCVHVWAQNNQDEGRGSNLDFRRGRVYQHPEYSTLYSYVHWPIGEIRRHPEHGVYVLLRSETYSPSTSRQQYLARQAVSHRTVFTLAYACWDDKTGEKTCAHYREQRDAAILQAKRAIKYKQQALNEAQADCDAFNRYAAFMGWPERLEMPTSEEMTALHEAAKRKSAAEAEARKARRAEWAALQAEKAAAAQEGVKAWLAGDSCQYWALDFAEHTLLRLKPGDPTTIQTSRGAEVPRHFAAGLWQMAKHARRSGQGHTPMMRANIGNFTLDEITNEGDLIIGCHTLKFAELERFAVVLGLPSYTKEEA